MIFSPHHLPAEKQSTLIKGERFFASGAICLRVDGAAAGRMQRLPRLFANDFLARCYILFFVLCRIAVITSFRPTTQIQLEPFSGDRPRGHAGERLPERLLRLRWVPASDHQEVPFAE